MVELEFTVTMLNGTGKVNEKGTTLEMGTSLVFSPKPEMQWGKSSMVAVVSEEKESTAEMNNEIKW